MKVSGLQVSPTSGETLFNGLDLCLATGSYTLVCGPTGSGKSTLAMVLAGCHRGEVQGQVSGGPVAAVWQDPGAQMSGHNALDEVRLPMDYRCIPADVATARARDLIGAVGLSHLPENRDPMLLSGGEQQRLALAAALAQGAPVLVLDEVTSQLDAEGRRDFLRVLDELAGELTILVVDHDPAPHLERADRIIVLGERGRVIADGPSLPDSAERLGIRVPGGRLGDLGEATGCTGRDWQELDLGFARLPRGARAAVTGANGAGKSTLLNSLTRRKDLLLRGVTWVPQRGLNHLFSPTVRDELSSCSHGHDLEAAGLSDLAERHPLSLSGGQRQRLAIAKALGAGPARLALLDKPSYSQDLSGTQRVARMILTGAEDRVTLMATHDHALIDALATHVIHVSNHAVVGVSSL